MRKEVLKEQLPMDKKLDIPKIDSNTPQCEMCIQRITDHVNGIMGVFEVNYNDLLNSVNERADKTFQELMVSMSIKNNEALMEHFRKQALKEDEAMAAHFEKQDEKYSEQRKENNEQRKENWGTMVTFMKFVSVVILTCASIVGYNFVSNLETSRNKADKNEVLTKTESFQLIEKTNNYYDKHYVINPVETIEKFQYQWFIEDLFGGGGSRSARKIEPKTNTK